ncbi:glycerate kinase type-2 family protein [Rubrobacter radiotolerans]|uniref:Glycerate kinase n=2 Tax=Rubrobacter radiotolerans TaxID=42256 RepID=A0AB35T7W9_RUBRA|nr:glycerate kinase [Rubrobacter radiotolerans]MDX5894950.1 glycerate kinase [Rubrobacter radiotolerans]SMC07137.1 glycerate 2-kinase [Rubrobacter radiotolerans DSM 5868]
MREVLESILSAGLAAADPALAVERHLGVREGEVASGDGTFPARRVFVLSAGKAAGAMAEAAERVLRPVRAEVEGLVVTKYDHRPGPEVYRTLFAAHPEPDEAGVEAARRVTEAVGELEEGDLLLALISGGASALLADPEPPVELAEIKELTGALLRSGAAIDEINCVRKHVSTLKGGGLVRLAAPARTLALLLSDVVGDNLSSIASGLTAPDPTTLEDARDVLRRYRIEPPGSVRELLDGARETPKPGDPVFENVTNVLCGSGRASVEAAAGKARELGYAPLVLSTSMTGDCRGIASAYGAVVREVLESGNPLEAPCALVSGGEATVTVRGDGEGGPNQEFSLALALELDGVPGWAAFSVDTDGNDGPTDAAGGLVDGETVQKIREAGHDPEDLLAENASKAALEAAGALVVTGPTGTNVNDLRVALVET